MEWHHPVIALLCLLVVVCNAVDDETFSFEQDILDAATAVNPAGGEKFEKKKLGVKTGLKAAKTQLKTAGENEDLQGGVEDIGGGLVQVVQGIASGSWSDMIIGALGLVGSLASLAGPLGASLATVLSIVSMVFGLFGGAEEAEESQQDMMKRVITEALTKAKADDLRADGESLKKVVSSIRNSVNQFREESSLSRDQATELYNKAFQGLQFFGKLKFYIDKFCDCSVPNPADQEAVSKARSDAKRCLEFVNLYADTSILRQLLIADIASLAGAVGLNGTATNLLYLTDKEKTSDKDIMMFLLDPIGNRAQRFCIAQYFGTPNDYPTVKAYLKVLSKQKDGKQVSKNVMVCSQPELTGMCYRLEPKDYRKSALKDWAKDGNIKSIYVSEGLSVTGYSKDNFRGASYGPIPGPTVIGIVPGKWVSMKIKKIPPGLSYVRVCEKEALSQEGRCDELSIKEYPDLNMISGQSETVMTEEKKQCLFPFQDKKGVTHNKCAYDDDENKYWCAWKTKNAGMGWEEFYDEWDWCDFPQTWKEKVTSMSIPRNTEVYLYSQEKFQGRRFGPFYGPGTIDKVCGGNTVKSIKIQKSDKKVSNMVKVCRGEAFSDVCDFIELGNYRRMTAHGCYYNKETTKIKSVQVPGGLAVYLFTKDSYNGLALGPYIGPISVPVIDAGEASSEETDKSQVKSMKIIKYSRSVEQPLRKSFIRRLN